jgi:hypothetical protein
MHKRWHDRYDRTRSGNATGLGWQQHYFDRRARFVKMPAGKPTPFRHCSPFLRQIIMYTIKVRHLAACVAVSTLLPLHAHAQPAPGDAPPRLERLEEGQAPETAPAPAQPQDRIIERRARGGQVTEVEVSKGGSNYVVKPNEQAGNALPGDLQSNRNRGAQWQVFGFDLKREQEKGPAGPAEPAQRDIGMPPPEPTAPRK